MKDKIGKVYYNFISENCCAKGHICKTVHYTLIGPNKNFELERHSCSKCFPDSFLSKYLIFEIEMFLNIKNQLTKKQKEQFNKNHQSFVYGEGKNKIKVCVVSR